METTAHDDALFVMYQARVATGTWKSLPQPVLDWLDEQSLGFPEWMFPHMSIEGDGLIAYFPTAKNFKEDRPVRTTLGRALAKVHMAPSHVTAKAMQMLKLHTTTVKLQIAVTEDDIEWVYAHGPDSCMSHDTDDYSTDGVHPVRVYASGDIGVAYVANHAGRVTARTVVNLKEKLYSTIYGSAVLLESALSAEGYEHEHSALVGCRILRLETDVGYIICPYMDGDYGINEHDSKYLLITEDGEGTWSPYETSGLLEYVGVTCDYCGDNVQADDLEEIINGYMMCSGCRDEFAVWSDYLDGWLHVDDVACTEDGLCVSRDDTVYIEYDDVWILEEDASHIIIDNYTGWARTTDITADAITGDDILIPNAVEHPDGYTMVPEDEWPEAEEEAA